MVFFAAILRITQRVNMNMHWIAKTNRQTTAKSLDEEILNWEPVLAYGLFGWLLGTLTPGLCVLLILLDKFSLSNENDRQTAGFFLIVVAICSGVGLFAGAAIGVLMKFLRSRVHWIVPILAAPFLGVIWGVIAGGAGGLPIMIIGALFGAIIAGVVGGFGFGAFALIYELLARRFRFGFWQSPLLALTVALFFSGLAAILFYLNSAK